MRKREGERAREYSEEWHKDVNGRERCIKACDEVRFMPHAPEGEHRHEMYRETGNAKSEARVMVNYGRVGVVQSHE